MTTEDRGLGVLGARLVLASLVLLGTPFATGAAETAAKDATSTATDDEWGKPPVEPASTAGRDEDARRRLTDLETWQKKVKAKEAKEAEDAAEKVKFDLSLKYKTRVNGRRDLDLGNPSQRWPFDDAVYVDQRFQLGVSAEYGPLFAVLILDKGNFVFDWKEDSEGTLERWGEFQTVNSALVREMYAQYTGRVVVKVGRQSMMLGNGGIVLEGPMDALQITYPVGRTPLGRLSVSAAYLAVAGGFRDYTRFGPGPAGDRSSLLGALNRLDGYLLAAELKPAKTLTVVAFGLKVVDRGHSGAADLNLDRDFDATTLPRDGSFEPLWVGLAFSGRVGGFSYLGDAILVTGPFTVGRRTEGYAATLRGDYHFRNVGPLGRVSLGLEGGRGSGDSAEQKAAGTGAVNDFRGLFLCRERRKFGNIFSEDVRAGFFFADSNLANVTFGRAILELEPMKGLKANLSVARLFTTERVFEGRGPVLDWSRGAAVSTQKTSDIGWEADLNLDFPIMHRVRGFLELGYFAPGAVYVRADGRDAKPAAEAVAGAEVVF